MRRRVWIGLLLLCVSSATVAPARAEEGRQPFRQPSTAALKSLVFPGWGQHGNQQSGKGWAFLGIAAVGAVLGLEVIQISSGGNDADFQRGIGLSLIGLSLGVGAVDAFVHAGRLNRENGYDLGYAPQTAGSLTLLAFSF